MEGECMCHLVVCTVSHSLDWSWLSDSLSLSLSLGRFALVCNCAIGRQGDGTGPSQTQHFDYRLRNEKKQENNEDGISTLS